MNRFFFRNGRKELGAGWLCDSSILAKYQFDQDNIRCFRKLQLNFDKTVLHQKRETIRLQ